MQFWVEQESVYHRLTVSAFATHAYVDQNNGCVDADIASK